MFHAQQLPGEVLDWGLDYRPALAGATMLSSTWAISPTTGITLVGQTMTAEQVTMSVSAPQQSAGQIFVLTNTLVSEPDTLVEQIELFIKP